MREFLSRLLDTADFPPRWNSEQWSAGQGWLHILSDLAVWGAYLAIPLCWRILRLGGDPLSQGRLAVRPSSWLVAPRT
jgi:hypothetical protein